MRISSGYGAPTGRGCGLGLPCIRPHSVLTKKDVSPECGFSAQQASLQFSVCPPPQCPETWLTSDTVFLEVVSPLPRCRPQMPVAGGGSPGCPHFCLTRQQIRASGDPSSGSSFARTARRTQGHAPTRLPGAGVSVLWVAGHPFPARKFSEPRASGMFMEASSRRHHRFLAPSPACRPSPKVGSWGWKF